MAMKRSITSITSDVYPIQNKQIKIEVDNVASTLPSENDFYEEIWSQLKVIASEIASDRRKEVNDIIFVLSSDPDSFTFLDIDYGDRVHSIIKKTTKLLYRNGAYDSKLSEYLWAKRNELIKTLSLSYLTVEKAISSDWTAVRTVANSLFNDFFFDVDKRPKPDMKVKRLLFQIKLSTHPSTIRNHITSLEIGTAKVEVVVAICKHILDGVNRNPNSEFRQSRNKVILRFWNIHLWRTVSDTTFSQVRRIVTKYWRHETDELQIHAFTILLIMDIKTLRSKYLLFNEAAHVNEESLDDVESELKMCFEPPDTIQRYNKTENECTTTDSVSEISMPIIAHLKHKGYIKRFDKKMKIFLHLTLLGRTDLKLIGECRNRKLICENQPTLELLKVIVTEFSPNVTIDSWIQLAADDIKEIIMLSPTRLNKPFNVYMASIKAAYPMLRTNLWAWLSSASQWKWHIYADVQSIAYLERYNRRLEVEDFFFKFDVRYTNLREYLNSKT